MTTVTVHRDRGVPISRDLWGVFFEDINHAADGGLYAELVQNRSFAYSAADRAGWHAFTAWTVEGDVRTSSEAPLSPTAPVFARLGGRGTASRLTNDGFDGITLREGAEYRFSTFARSTAPTRLHVSVSWAGGAVGAHVDVAGSGTWDRYETVLRAPADVRDGRLTLHVGATAPSAVDVDLVSLFPRRVFGAVDENGLREDLAQAVADLRPRFVRFPGGCVAHGLGLSNMYRWPDSVGPLQDRVQDSNLWGYHQSRGLGYLELFVFCARLGATPLPVVAAGVCCQNTLGGPLPLLDDEMDVYVQEVLDLVEFANGDEGTRWGGVRASLGHPAPFGLRYLGLGNEDQVDEVFRRRFTQLFSALRERHPEVQVVGTAGPSPQGPDFDAGWALAREVGVPIVDEHAYKSPRWFFQNVHRYDAYDRGGPRVYLGEYGSWGNSMLNALAEAAFMTGLERNGDVVALASYAPLFGRIGRSQWLPDLVYFDADEVHVTLNHHVQSMFASTAGDVSHPVVVTDAPVAVRAAPGPAGAAVSAQGFAVHVTDVRVQGRRVDDVRLDLPASRAEIPVDPATQGLDIALEMTVAVVDGDADRGSFAVHVGDLAGGDHREWSFGTWLNRTMTLHTTVDGFRDEAAPGVPFHVEVGRTYRIAVAVSGGGTVFSTTVDGRLLHRHEIRDEPEHRVVASCVTDEEARRTHLRLVNATQDEQEVTLLDERGRRLRVRGARTLTAAPTDGRPEAPAPARPEVLAVEDELRVPAHSVTVVELD